MSYKFHKSHETEAISGGVRGDLVVKVNLKHGEVSTKYCWRCGLNCLSPNATKKCVPNQAAMDEQFKREMVTWDILHTKTSSSTPSPPISPEVSTQ